MYITFAPREILQIDEAAITFKNFSGEPTQFNREGDRNFSLRIEDRELFAEEVQGILELYREAEMVMRDDKEVLMYNNTEIYTVADALIAFGWNVKIKPPRNDGDSPFMHMKVNVKYNEYGPNIYLITNGRKNQLSEEDIKCLDYIDIERIDMDIRPYDWTTRTGSGRTAYLQTMYVTQKVDRFAERYAD